MKVAKFGGSSVANSSQLIKVANIIKNDPDKKIIVVSAPGKRYESDYKITDLLIQLAEAHDRGDKYKSYYLTILDRFQKFINELDLPQSILNSIDQRMLSIMESDQPFEEKLDAYKSIGEDSSAKVLSAYLTKLGIEAHYVNPKDAGIIVKADPMGAQLLPGSYDLIYQLRKKSGVLVVPGFFGFTKSGDLATFSRGGSDITGAILAAGLKASMYENFTDVDSVYAVNPTIVKDPKEIKMLTYREMRELSYAGFSVFHDEALIPAFDAKIPVCIKNTNNPDSEGTLIVSKKQHVNNNNCVVGIASDKGFTSIYVSKFLMNRELGFGRKLFQILEEEHVSFEHAPSGIDDMSIIVRDSQLTPEKEEIVVNRIKNELNADTITVHHHLALIMVVGEGMRETIGMAQTATMALGKANVNIEMINQGSSEVSMMFGIKSNDLSRAIKSLYQAFFLEESLN